MNSLIAFVANTVKKVATGNKILTVVMLDASLCCVRCVRCGGLVGVFSGLFFVVCLYVHVLNKCSTFFALIF